MKRMFRKGLTYILIVSIVLVYSPFSIVYANSQAQEKPHMKSNELMSILENANYLPVQHKALVSRTFEESDFYLIDSFKDKSIEVALYSTIDPNIIIAVTNGHIEVVEKIDDYKFLINDQLLTVEVTIDNTPPITIKGWEEISNPGGGWTYVRSKSYNFIFDKPIKNFSIGALTAVISYVIGGPAGLALSIAMVIGGAVNELLLSSSVAKSDIKEYEHKTNPNLYKRYDAVNYIKYDNEYVKVGSKTTYYTWVPGGP